MGRWAQAISPHPHLCRVPFNLFFQGKLKLQPLCICSALSCGAKCLVVPPFSSQVAAPLAASFTCFLAATNLLTCRQSRLQRRFFVLLSSGDSAVFGEVIQGALWMCSLHLNVAAVKTCEKDMQRLQLPLL